MDPARSGGAVHRAAGWIGAGRTRGFARQGRGHLDNGRPKLVFPLPLSREARGRLRAFHLDPGLHRGVPGMAPGAEQMRTLPDFFRDIDDPRRRAGRRRPLPSVLALAAAAVLCGMRGCRAIWEWAGDPVPAALRRFRKGRHELPGEWVVRDVLVRAGPEQPGAALRAWREAHGGGRGTALATGGKTMRGAVDGEGRRTVRAAGPMSPASSAMGPRRRRASLRGHGPRSRRRLPETPPRTEPRPLAGGGQPPHLRLELRRGPEPHPHRPRSREHDPAAALRDRPRQGPRPVRGRDARRVPGFLRMAGNTRLRPSAAVATA